MLATALLALVLAAPAAKPASPTAPAPAAKKESGATAPGTKPAPNAAVAGPRGSARAKPAVAPPPRIRGEVFVAPSVASLGEEWADEMAGGELGTVADRKAWSPAVAFGARSPLPLVSLEVDGSATRFSAPVPGGRTEGWVGHAAARLAWDAGRWGVEAGALARTVDLATPENKSARTAVFPSLELHGTSAGGTQAFVAAWNHPLLPYGDAGWLRAGARRAWGRLSGELAVGLDPVLDGEKAQGPVLESRIEVAAGKGVHLGVACRAADEPMAAFVVRRVFR